MYSPRSGIPGYMQVRPVRCECPVPAQPGVVAAPKPTFPIPSGTATHSQPRFSCAVLDSMRCQSRAHALALHPPRQRSSTRPQCTRGSPPSAAGPQKAPRCCCAGNSATAMTGPCLRFSASPLGQRKAARGCPANRGPSSESNLLRPSCHLPDKILGGGGLRRR